MQDYTTIRGFNYFPKPASSFYEAYHNFNEDKMELELRRAKEYFPNINTIRIQLSWNVFCSDPETYEQSFEKCLFIANRLNLRVIPSLYSRCPAMGNNWIDHFMDGYSWVTVRSEGGRGELFLPYLRAIVGKHRDDDRVLIWDICNEPFPYATGSYGASTVPEHLREIEQGEYEWLREAYEFCTSEFKPAAPLGVSVLQDFGRPGLERVESISDVLLIHPYYVHNRDNKEEVASFVKMLDDYSALSKEVNKPLIATETCWPSPDDDWHVENIRFTLSELTKRNIGWVAAKLHQGNHRTETLPGEPICADGSLRPGHEIFNDF